METLWEDLKTGDPFHDDQSQTFRIEATNRREHTLRLRQITNQLFRSPRGLTVLFTMLLSQRQSDCQDLDSNLT